MLCVLQLGLATQARLAKIEVSGPVQPVDSANISSTSDAREQANERLYALKKHNQLVVSAVTMADDLNEKRHRAMMVALGPWLQWHENRQLS